MSEWGPCLKCGTMIENLCACTNPKCEDFPWPKTAPESERMDAGGDEDDAAHKATHDLMLKYRHWTTVYRDEVRAVLAFPGLTATQAQRADLIDRLEKMNAILK